MSEAPVRPERSRGKRSRGARLWDDAALACPYCGEPADLQVEASGPSSEEYVEDCPVCCRPWTVRVSRSDKGASVSLDRSDG